MPATSDSDAWRLHAPRLSTALPPSPRPPLQANTPASSAPLRLLKPDLLRLPPSPPFLILVCHTLKKHFHYRFGRVSGGSGDTVFRLPCLPKVCRPEVSDLNFAKYAHITTGCI